MVPKDESFTAPGSSLLLHGYDGSDSGSESDEHEQESLLEDTTSNTGSSGQPRASGLSDEEEIKQLSTRETKRIRCWRIVVLIFILLVGACVAAGAYFALSAQEMNRYLVGVSP